MLIEIPIAPCPIYGQQFMWRTRKIIIFIFDIDNNPSMALYVRKNVRTYRILCEIPCKYGHKYSCAYLGLIADAGSPLHQTAWGLYDGSLMFPFYQGD